MTVMYVTVLVKVCEMGEHAKFVMGGAVDTLTEKQREYLFGEKG